MTQFIRVRDLRTEHELDVPTSYIGHFPDRYEVIDDEPVDKQRPPVFADHSPTPEVKPPKSDARLGKGDGVVNDQRLSQPTE